MSLTWRSAGRSSSDTRSTSVAQDRQKGSRASNPESGLTLWHRGQRLSDPNRLRVM
tara:strand:- start:1247 stop:1414 length:168 start_codon:yes stop_codon:yes gene_type:complete